MTLTIELRWGVVEEAAGSWLLARAGTKNGASEQGDPADC
jgi:hypothetical protein